MALGGIALAAGQASRQGIWGSPGGVPGRDLPYPAESCRILLQLWLEQTILVHFGSECFQIPAAAEIMKERIVCSAS